MPGPIHIVKEELNSLGFAKAPAQTRVVVAMSGGVDSSVTAAILVEQGFEVIGITLQLYDHGVAVQAKGACCAGADIHDARMVASGLGIPHYVLDYESLFREQVVDDFVDSYLAGHTPIPCVRCNQTVKFRDLLATARELDADCLATGHYVRREMIDSTLCLQRAVDDSKDQSYFLFATTPEQLDYLRFPLGDMTKAETRRLAEKFSLAVSDKPDSQDICFVPSGRYADVVRKLRPGAIEPGIIRHLDGTVLGQHKGVIDYTIGQRRGLGIGGRKTDSKDNSPLYVVGINADKHEVIVGPQSALACSDVYLTEVNWISPELVDMAAAHTKDGLPVKVKLRNTAQAAPARLLIKPDQSQISYGKATLRIALEAAEFGIAPGQAGVIYSGENDRLVLGGGWIAHAPTHASNQSG